MAGTAFLFPGQGAQKVGMGKELADNLPAARFLLDEANEVLGYDLGEVCFSGPEEKLNSTVVSQPAIFVCSLMALEALKAQSPDAVGQATATAGLSLGEYTALTFAGALSFRDGLRLVHKRGEAMQAAADATPSGMLSVLSLPREQVEGLVGQAGEKGLLKVANILCPGNTVVSGERQAIDEMERLVKEAGAPTVRLAVAGAFHTALMKPADEKLAAVLATVSLQPPRIPVWSNVDARPHTDPEEIRGLLVRQVLQPVLWEETMRNLLAAGVEQFYEVGPGRTLASLLKRVQRTAVCQNVQA